MGVPTSVVDWQYASGSLANDPDGFRFALRTAHPNGGISRVLRLRVDGADVPLENLKLVTPGGAAPDGAGDALVHAVAAPLAAGPHEIAVELDAPPFGAVTIAVRDRIGAPAPAPAARVPHVADDAANYGAELVARRRRFIEERTGVRLHHVASPSFDPLVTRGNIENFAGVAQVPIGIAGPIRVNGEWARGEFLVPLATTEGTLVASYSRGMKVLTLAGGVTTTVSDDRMQRAPVFVFDSAREARAFRDWVRARTPEIRAAAEGTSHVAHLLEIEVYLSNRFAYLRCDFSTGDAAGQNMVGKATWAATEWIRANAPGVRRHYLESNLATDKKHSHVNLLHTRGKRVTAEAVVPAALLRRELRAEPEALAAHALVANVGAFLSGCNNNGLHSANAIAALFIATGQDVANVAEGSAAVIYTELTAARDLYLSITIPSLIVATHGGGTALPTQRECLEMLGCYGKGKVNKLAEIAAATVLAGELSLAAAIAADEWVNAHERLGRKR